MRTTINLDDELVAKAAKYTGISERSALLRRALETLIHVEAGRRLAALGGSDPTAKAAPRRRPPYFLNPE
jgi:Arc/MetJ family transcription regulator